MKNTSLLLIVLIFALNSFAQIPEKISYQAVIRKNSNQLVVNHSIGMQVTILKTSVNGTAVFIERHFSTTNANGLISLEIGSGTLVSGSFNNIDWSEGPYFIKTEIDLNGHENYTITGTSQLMTVPYAFHARTVEVDKVEDADADPGNEIQTITKSGNTITLSRGGGSVIVPEVSGDNWGADYVRTNSTLDGKGTLSSPLKIAQRGATIGQVLKWAGTEWLPDNLTGTGNIWLQNESDIYFNTGKVGIGISTPLSKLSVGDRGVSNASIYGSTYATNGIGVYGKASYEWGNIVPIPVPLHYGGFFESIGSFGVGVHGEGETGITGKGTNSGVSGLTEKNTGVAIRGKASSTQGTNYGGHFTADGKSGTGVYGMASSIEDAINYGGYFTAKGQHGIGVYGHATTKEDVIDSYGGYFVSDANLGIGVHGNAKLVGGEFKSTNAGNIGFGIAAECSAVNGIAVSAEAKGMKAIAVRGWASHYSAYEPTYGGYFQADGTKGVGVFATGKYLAGWFVGHVKVQGAIDATSLDASSVSCTYLTCPVKYFQIDHPLKPETHYLKHASIESNQYMNIYTGTAELDENGEVWVEFPDWFTALNKEFTYQLTCIGGFANIYIAQELADNKLKIAGGKTGMKVSWMVTGIRHDKFVEENPLQAEIEKTDLTNSASF